MRKVVFILFFTILILTGCGQKGSNITFVATIESIQGNSILVTTTNDVGFVKASVAFDKNLKIPTNLSPGQVVEIEALPEIRESYPVQITAVKITLKEESKKAEYKKITPAQATEMMLEDVIILDVRTQAEYDEGHIPNALLLPNSEINSRAEKVLPNKEQAILVYCRSGRRSEQAVKALVKLGYMNVYDFGGIIDWPGEIIK